MMKGKKKLILLTPVVAAIAATFAGCGQFEKDALTSINEEALKVLNSSPVVSEMVDANFNDFDMLSADFTETESQDYYVDLSGVAKYNQNQKAFVTMSYTLDGENFVRINAKDKSAVLKMLSTLIGQEKMDSFDFVPVNSFKALNNTVKNISESPLDDFDFRKGLVFSLGDIKFDSEKSTVSFRIKTHVEYAKEEQTMIYLPITDPDGMTTVLPIPTTEFVYEDFVHTNDVYLNVSSEELQAMIEDQSLVFDKFVEYINSGNKDKYVINSVEVEKPTKFDTSILDNVNKLEDEIEM